MSIPVCHPSSFARGTFSIFVAPSSTISEALNAILARRTGNVLYICGNSPVFLSGLTPDKNQLQIKKVTAADQILSLIERADEPLILIEHDHSLYDLDADLIRPIGQICRKRASERGTIIMLAPRPDGWLKKFEPFAHRMKRQEDLIQYLPSQKTGMLIMRQRTLEGIICSS